MRERVEEDGEIETWDKETLKAWVDFYLLFTQALLVDHEVPEDLIVNSFFIYYILAISNR